MKYRWATKKIKTINTSLLRILDRFEMDRPQLMREKIKILMERGGAEEDRSEQLPESPLQKFMLLSDLSPEKSRSKLDARDMQLLESPSSVASRVAKPAFLTELESKHQASAFSKRR